MDFSVDRRLPPLEFGSFRCSVGYLRIVLLNLTSLIFDSLSTKRLRTIERVFEYNVGLYAFLLPGITNHHFLYVSVRLAPQKISVSWVYIYVIYACTQAIWSAGRDYIVR